MTVSQLELLQHYCDMSICANQIQFSLKHAALINEGLTFNNPGVTHTGIGD